MGVYVEIFIRGSLDDLWHKTQAPEEHQRWDLRFSRIEYLPRPDELQPQQFLYATRLGFGLDIRGRGEASGQVEAGGDRTSALKFWSDDPKSLIRAGSGYWQYRSQPGGVTFLTWYDYDTRFGWAGRAVDRLLFRPLIGWATAWSFDRLRLWIERGIDPASALRLGLLHALSCVGLAGIWLYQGLIPKLLFPAADELAMLMADGLSLSAARLALPVVGWAEVAFGLVCLAAGRSRWLFLVNIGLMLLALAGVALRSPEYLTAAFNPVALNLAVIVLAVVGYVAAPHAPWAGRCRRAQPERGQ